MNQISEDILLMVHAFSDPERKNAVRALAARVDASLNDAHQRGADAVRESVAFMLAREATRLQENGQSPSDALAFEAMVIGKQDGGP